MNREVPTRRSLLIGAVLAGAAPLAIAGASHAAGGTLAKATAKYQDKPMNGQVCSGCSYWLPGKTPKDKGLCKLVAGPIDPNGWCQLYAAKPK
ncbi:MAG TPA: high-potential iron-sulfur protein [Caulobacteraceae bacterium]|jgi:hypothetical protein|nr:high-potential iron-sulfur protein [Caulobacteraceae bacterium]